MSGEEAERENEESDTVPTISTELNSTTDSFQSYRAELFNESLQAGTLLTCEEFVEKSNVVLGHLRSQQKISLKAIEDIYQKQVRRNQTSDKMLAAMER